MKESRDENRFGDFRSSPGNSGWVRVSMTVGLSRPLQLPEDPEGVKL